MRCAGTASAAGQHAASTEGRQPWYGGKGACGLDGRGVHLHEQLLHCVVRGQNLEEWHEPAVLVQKLQVHVLVVVLVGEDPLDRRADLHAKRLLAHAGQVARELDEVRPASVQAIRHYSDPTEWPHCRTKRRVVEQ